MIQEKLRLLIVEARFYDDLADELLKGASDVLSAHGAEFDVVSVPGALEIPGAVAMAHDARHSPAGVTYDGYVALGTVIRGETYHFEIVSNESARGLMDLTVRGLGLRGKGGWQPWSPVGLRSSGLRYRSVRYYPVGPTSTVSGVVVVSA